MADTDNIIEMPSIATPGRVAESWQTITSAAGDAAVDTDNGRLVYLHLTENTAIKNPGGTLRHGERLTFLFLNTADPWAVTWDTKYKLVGGALTVTVGVKHTVIQFIYNEVSDLFYEMSRSLNEDA